MSSTVHAIPGRAIALASAALLTLSILPVSAAGSVDELVELNLRAWSGEPELLGEVYAPDAVHTATFYDRTAEYSGPDEIAMVVGYGAIEPIGPRIDLPAVDGEWRWASFASLGGGTACLFHAVDGLLVRHDCIVPERSSDSRPKAGLADAEASAAIDELTTRMAGTWGTGATVERLAEVYAPEAVHTARYQDRTMTYTGPEEIISVAGLGGSVSTIGERVDFEAPEGELAWASVADVGGGSVCLFRAVDGMVTRHDCVLPVR
jgi:hypothetical protein